MSKHVQTYLAYLLTPTILCQVPQCLNDEQLRNYCVERTDYKQCYHIKVSTTFIKPTQYDVVERCIFTGTPAEYLTSILSPLHSYVSASNDL